MKTIIYALIGLILVGATAQAAVYDISTAASVTFNSSVDTLTNTNGITDWDAATGLNINDGSDLSNVDFTALGITSWTESFVGADVTIWDGANLSGLVLSFTGHNNFYNDSFDGTDFSGATINTSGNQPFLASGANAAAFSMNNVNFSGTTFRPTFDGTLGFIDYANTQVSCLAGADFSNSIWDSAVGSSLFDVGPGTTSIADKALAADFSGADFSGLNATVKAFVIANLGKFDGGTAIGAKYDAATLSKSGWAEQDLIDAGWQNSNTSAPIAVIQASPLSGTPPLEVAFDASGSTSVYGIVSNVWNFGDGNSATGMVVTNTYTVISNYTATLTVTDASNQTAMASVNITVGEDIGSIWFIGDSITQSNADGDATGSPRKSLYDLLIADGKIFNYTGHFTANVDGLPTTGGTVADNFYHYHSGVSGIRIGEAGGASGFAFNLASYWATGRLPVVKPNKILIMLGTNDVATPDGAIDRLRKLVQDIYALSGIGNPTIYLASIPPNGRNASDTAYVVAFNAEVPGIVSEFRVAGKDVRFVDQFTPLNDDYATVMNGDNLHPNAAGNDVMAQTWFDAIFAPVDAYFSATPMSGSVPLTVDFDASISTSETAIVSYNWDFGDGATNSGLTTSNTYTVPGTYQAFLVITNASSETATASVEIAVSEWSGTQTNFHGFDMYTFTTNGLDCKVAVPDVTAEGKPWIWRARFWDLESAPDVALLSNGYHVVYVDVADLFGSPTAVARFDAFYSFLTGEHGFDDRAVLEGMDRGGLAIYNWAAQNPEKVHCVYADAPVCDFKSWPYETGTPVEWTNCLTAYGMTEGQALVYGGNPVDNMQALADAGVPLLHVVGDIDTTVPVSNNTAIVETNYNGFGGWIDVIHKPGVAHVHGLTDPTPIIDFILNGMNDIHNLEATSVDKTSATMNGLLSLPGTNYSIEVYWGLSDGGTNTGGWGDSAPIGSWTTGDTTRVTYDASTLIPGSTYYYSFSASNENGRVWDDALTFTLDAVPPAVAALYIGDSASEGTNVTSGVNGYGIVPLTIVMHTGSPVIYTAPSLQDLTLTQVNFYVNANGTVTPFVAKYDGSSSTLGSGYEILAIGDALTVTGGVGLENRAFTVNGTNPVVRVSFGDQIIAGFLYTGGAVVRLADDASGLADYVHSGDSITSQSVGDPLSGNSTWNTFDKTMKFNIGFNAVTVPLPNTIVVDTSKSADGSPPSFSTNDLAQTQYLSSEATGANEVATLHADLFNGIIGTSASGTATDGVTVMDSANTLTVTLDTSVNRLGYDITGIDTVFGWNIAANGRSNQGYSIELGFMDGSTGTLVNAAHWEPNAPPSFWTKVSFISGDGEALNSSTLVTNGVSVAGTGVIAENVKSITFDISEDANAGGTVMGREFDIFGFPSEPKHTAIMIQ